MYKPDDSERAMYIYKQRKEEKRTFADIGQELGITGKRVAQIYRRIDWDLNGDHADHHQKKTKPYLLINGKRYYHEDLDKLPEASGRCDP